jgi:hypothetical protein
MAVKTYSLKKDGETSLSTNFKVKEFKCHDGSDTILIDTATVGYLQAARRLTGTAITINSAYRTSAYNKKIGGASASQHVKGKACDTYSKAGCDLLAKIYELLGANGIGYYTYSPFVHVDCRDSKYWWKMTTAGGSYISQSTFCGKTIIKNVQAILNSAYTSTKNSNYNCGTADGIIGTKTKAAFNYFCLNANDSWRNKMLTALKG